MGYFSSNENILPRIALMCPFNILSEGVILYGPNALVIHAFFDCSSVYCLLSFPTELLQLGASFDFELLFGHMTSCSKTGL